MDRDSSVGIATCYGLDGLWIESWWLALGPPASYTMGKGKGKAVLLQALSGPEASRKLRFPDFMTTAQDGGKVVSLRTGCLYPPGNAPGTHFC